MANMETYFVVQLHQGPMHAHKVAMPMFHLDDDWCIGGAFLQNLFCLSSQCTGIHGCGHFIELETLLKHIASRNERETWIVNDGFLVVDMNLLETRVELVLHPYLHLSRAAQRPSGNVGPQGRLAVVMILCNVSLALDGVEAMKKASYSHLSSFEIAHSKNLVEDQVRIFAKGASASPSKTADGL